MSIFNKISSFFKKEKTISPTGQTLQWLVDNWVRGDNSQPVRTSSLIYACVNLITDNITESQIKFYDKITNNDLNENHPLTELLMNPNESMTWNDFLSRTAMYYKIYGEAFWVVIPSVGQMANIYNYPARLEVVDPLSMSEQISGNELTGWSYNPSNYLNQQIDPMILPKELVIQIKNQNPYNYYRGLSALDALKSMIEIDSNSVGYQKRFLENNASMATVIVMDKEIKGNAWSKEKLLEVVYEFDKRHKGRENAGKTGILTPGLDIKTLGISQKDMMMLDTLDYTKDMILRTFRIPEYALGITKELNRATAREMKEALWSYCLKPINEKISHALNYKIINKIDPRLGCYFDYSKVLPKYSFSVQDIPVLLNAGYTRNEINERLDLGFDNDPEGDIRFPQYSLFDSNNQSEQMVDENNSNKSIHQCEHSKAQNKNETMMVDTYDRTQRTMERILLSKINRYAFEQRNDIIKSIFNNNKSSNWNKEGILNQIEELLRSQDQKLVNMLNPIYAKIIQEAGQMSYKFMAINRNYLIDQSILTDRLNMIKDINDTTFNQLKTTILKSWESGDSLDTLANNIKSYFNETYKNRSKTIARTESSALISETTQKEYAVHGIQYKRWVATKDEKTRPEHINNNNQGAIPITDSFSSGEQYPGQKSINCRCALIPVINNRNDYTRSEDTII